MAYKLYSTSVSLSDSDFPSLLSLLKTASRSCIFPLVKTSFSNLSLVMLARLGLRTSPAVLNMRSTAAELGKAVLYLMNSETGALQLWLASYTHTWQLSWGFSGFTWQPVLLPLVSTLYILSAWTGLKTSGGLLWLLPPCTFLNFYKSRLWIYRLSFLIFWD